MDSGCQAILSEQIVSAKVNKKSDFFVPLHKKIFFLIYLVKKTFKKSVCTRE